MCKKLNERIKKVVRVLNHRNILKSTSNSELARLSDVSRKTVSGCKDLIDLYALSAKDPSSADELVVDKKIVKNYIEYAIKETNRSKYVYSNILGAITGYVLRQEKDLINNVNQPEKVVNIGLSVINLVSQIQARKDADKIGTPIHSNNKYAKYLLNTFNKVGFVDSLFTRSDTYKTGSYPKRWSLTTIAEEVLARVVELFFLWMEKDWVTLSPDHILLPICSANTVTLNNSSQSLYFYIPIRQLHHLSLPSILTILNHSHASTDPQTIAVSLANISSTDSSIGRHYNVFVRLRSNERKALGYHNYDISGGIQTICLQILYKQSANPNLFDNYSLLYQYAVDPKYKQKVRDTIANDLNMKVDDVKALLTAYANGGSMNIDKHSLLKEFYEESDALRREVLSITAQMEPEVLKRAIEQSSRELPESYDWKLTHKEEEKKEARAKASVFFFVWTYYESQIREAMLSCVNDGISVHDAIYSKQIIPYEDMQEIVFEKTGFVVRISG